MECKEAAKNIDGLQEFKQFQRMIWTIGTKFPDGRHIVRGIQYGRTVSHNEQGWHMRRVGIRSPWSHMQEILSGLHVVTDV